MRKTKTVVYKTHPIYKAFVWLMLTVTLAALLFAWAVYASATASENRYAAAMKSAAYEAYLSLCESVGGIANEEGNAQAHSRLAADALSRYALFSEEKLDASTLRELFFTGQIDPSRAKALWEVLSSAGSGKEAMADAVASAVRLAEQWSDGAVIRSANVRADGWRRLSVLPEIREQRARALAERVIGGGGEVRLAESHTFPLVYVYTNGNATAEISRMGGKLLRMCIFPLGSASKRTDAECFASAERFLEAAGITDASLMQASSGEESISYIFAPEEGGASVVITVARGGAEIIFFDAYEYYRGE